MLMIEYYSHLLVIVYGTRIIMSTADRVCSGTANFT